MRPALRSCAQTVRLLQQDLDELSAAARDLSRVGITATGFPLPLVRAVPAQLQTWEQTPAGRAALGLDALPRGSRRLSAMARADLARAEERLERPRRLSPSIRHPWPTGARCLKRRVVRHRSPETLGDVGTLDRSAIQELAEELRG